MDSIGCLVSTTKTCKIRQLGIRQSPLPVCIPSLYKWKDPSNIAHCNVTSSQRALVITATFFLHFNDLCRLTVSSPTRMRTKSNLSQCSHRGKQIVPRCDVHLLAFIPTVDRTHQCAVEAAFALCRVMSCHFILMR